MTDAFEDLLAANREYASTHELSGFDGVAHAGVAVVTCMDSRIDPLRMLGLQPGDAKIFRNPGGRITSQALEALVLGVHLLNVKRILIVPHTRCAMATSSLEEIREKVGASAGPAAAGGTDRGGGDRRVGRPGGGAPGGGAPRGPEPPVPPRPRWVPEISSSGR